MPCNASAPELRAAYEQFKSEGLEILSISMSEENTAVEGFISKYGLTYPFVMDRDGAAATLYGVVESPTTIFVGRNGEIVDQSTGVVTTAWVEKNLRRVGAIS